MGICPHQGTDSVKLRDLTARAQLRGEQETDMGLVAPQEVSSLGLKCLCPPQGQERVQLPLRVGVRPSPGLAVDEW